MSTLISGQVGPLLRDYRADETLSSAQLGRVTTQGMTLLRFYEELDRLEALPREQLPANGVVVAAAQAAGKYFGYNEQTVRIWRTDFEIDGECRFGRDSRGTWPRELLIHEEDLKKKFCKWMRKAAKERRRSAWTRCSITV